MIFVLFRFKRAFKSIFSDLSKAFSRSKSLIRIKGLATKSFSMDMSSDISKSVKQYFKPYN